MPRCPLNFLIAVAFVLAGNVTAQAGWLNELGRDLGVGWSDGYHAFDGCAKCPVRAQPWCRRSQRSGPAEDHLPLITEMPVAPPAQPAPAGPPPAPPPEPESLPIPKTSRGAPTRTSRAPVSPQLHISRPSY